MKEVYNKGLELQHKMHQIESFNSCNDDRALEKGRTQYCESLFGGKQNEFVFWNQAQIKDECSHVADQTCAQMNENLFSKYGELEKKTLNNVEMFVN